MATVRLMTTVLPYSVDPAAPFHLSLYFSHQLDTSGNLSDYPAMVNWVATLQNATFSLKTDSSASPIACKPQLEVASQKNWQTAFPDYTVVRVPTPPKVTDTAWRTYPANRIPDHAIDAHQVSLCASPASRPTVTGSPLATAVLQEFQHAGGEVPGLIRRLQDYPQTRSDYLDQVATARQEAAAAAVTPAERAPGQSTGGPKLQKLQPHPAAMPIGVPPSAIELLSKPNMVIDGQISTYLDGVAAGTNPGAGPAAPMLRDAHLAHSYYFRPEEQPPAPTLRALDTQAPPDFHERASAAANVPALLRALGLVVDVTVDAADLDTLATATEIWCDVTVAGVENDPSPVTLCTVSGDLFLAVAQDSNRWSDGRLRVGDDDRYTVLDLDPDAAGQSLEQHLRSAIRALAIEANGDPGSFSPAALRCTGFAVAEIDRPTRLKTQLQAAEAVQQKALQPDPKASQFNYEALLRGLRVEVWDDVTDSWHSLHERTVTASFGDEPILVGVPDAGLLQHPPMNRVPGNDANPYYVHEVLAGWDGWSLSAPRPWKAFVEATDGPAPDAPGLEVRSIVAPGSLPALRYGRTYSFRIVGVDLAGNSVPMDAAPSTPAAADVAAAQTYLDAAHIRAAARDQSSLSTALLNAGSLLPSPSGGSTARSADIQRAMASAVTSAGRTRLRPELTTSAEHLAALAPAAGDPATVSVPRPFLRWDPVAAPALVPRVAYATGESLQRMVIRTGLVDGPGSAERHVVPPKGSQLQAEQDGRFDALMANGDTVRAYAIGLKESGSLFYNKIQDLADPAGLVEQPGIALLSAANVTAPKTLGDIQDPNVQPAAGQYIVHDVDDLVVPYLPDPMAAGFSLVFYESGSEHLLGDPRVLQSVTVDYQGDWPELQPIRLVLHTADALHASLHDNVIDVGLPPGRQVGVRLSSTLDDEHLAKMALWVINPANDPNTPPADREVLANAARDGWLWWLTPDEDLRMVHATARPAIPPRIAQLAAEPRTPGIATATLDGVLDVDGVSTDKVELRAQWTGWVDDPGAPGPVQRTTHEVVTDYPIGESERYSLLSLDLPVPESNPPDPNHPADPGKTKVGSRSVEVPIRSALHNLPDTKARLVSYQLYGSSRYREFFAPNELPTVDDPGSMGAVVAVNIPSSAAPAPPIVHDLIPMFLWEQVTEPEHPFAIRRTRRSGVRIWLNRPWFSSGDDEMLAIIVTGKPGLPDDKNESVSLWARDPILVGAAIPNSYEVPVLTAWEQRAVQLDLAPESLPGRPELHVVTAGAPATGPDRDNVVNAYAYLPEFNAQRDRWFVDAVFETAGVSWPFLRLAVARYQANSLPGLEFSKVVGTDFVQLPPERVGTLNRPDAQRVRITVSGVTAATNAPGVQLPDQPPDHDTLAGLVTTSHRVQATLQMRSAASDSDLDWSDITAVPATLAGVDATSYLATWTAELPLQAALQLQTPGTDFAMRVQIEEFEILSADPHSGQATLTPAERLVYADHFYL
jgi:hypothetical protein